MISKSAIFNQHKWLCNKVWALPILGIFMILISPLYIPIVTFSIWFPELISYYNQCLDCIFIRLKT